MLITLFRFLSFFPLPILHGIGACSGWLVYLLSPTYRRRLQENIRQAGFARFTARAVSEVGKGVLELPFIWYASPERVHKTIKKEHWDIVQEAIDAQQGIIFLTPHLGCFEITPQIMMAAKAPITILYRPPRKKALQPLMENARSRTNVTLAPANLTGVRSMLKALKKGEAVGLLPDQVPQQGEGIWADFFGRAAYTMTLSFKLHSLTGAPIILAYAERRSWGRGYVVRFSRFIPSQQGSETPQQQARAINAAMEKLIAQCPAQYIWSYNRYKTPAHITAATPAVVSDNELEK